MADYLQNNVYKSVNDLCRAINTTLGGASVPITSNDTYDFINVLNAINNKYGGTALVPSYNATRDVLFLLNSICTKIGAAAVTETQNASFDIVSYLYAWKVKVGGAAYITGANTSRDIVQLLYLISQVVTPPVTSSYTLDFVTLYPSITLATKNAMTTLEASLTSAGLINYATPSTNKITNAYLFAGGTNVAASLGNFLNLPAPLIAYGGLTYTTKGIQGNAVNGYLDTGIYGDSLNLNDNHLGFCNYQMNTGLNGDIGVGLISQSPYAAILPALGYTTIDDIYNASFRISYTDYALAGTHYTTNVSAGSTKESYKNGVLMGTLVTTPSPHDTIVLLGARQFYSQNTMNFAHFGKSLNATEITALYLAVKAFNTTLGR